VLRPLFPVSAPALSVGDGSIRDMQVLAGQLQPGMTTHGGRQIVSIEFVPPATVAVTCASGEQLRWHADQPITVRAEPEVLELR
jgi:hypothetical protein